MTLESNTMNVMSQARFESLETRLFDLAQLIFTVSDGLEEDEENVCIAGALRSIAMMTLGLSEDCGEYAAEYGSSFMDCSLMHE